MKATITFERLGRSGQGPLEPLVIEHPGPSRPADADVIAGAVQRIARTHLMSKDIEVAVDLEQRVVLVYAGVRAVGRGIIVVEQGGSQA